MMTNMVAGGSIRVAADTAACCCGLYRPASISLETLCRQCARASSGPIRATAGASGPRKKKRALAGPLWNAHLDVQEETRQKTNGVEAVIGAFDRTLSARQRPGARFVN